ncbi:MAG: glycerophosphodiester phosphodiesterase [Lachnospiraceae bacterium]|nr:glycerophosphodiester phosphodiesterase [Lachnospiraceae bacterium]
MFCLRTNQERKEELTPFTKVYIAHRGLFDNENIPENSRSAFREAMRHGYGIELDVRLTKDLVPVVFHDDTLLRMCGVEKKVSECTYEELCTYSLLGTEKKIPTLVVALKDIAGSVPVLVEIKAGRDWKRTAAETAAVLDSYNGVYAVQAFHPMVLVWFRKHRPQVLRGQLSTDYRRDHVKCTWLQKAVRTDLWCNVLTYPDFISFRYTMTDLWVYRLWKRRYGGTGFGWTIRSKEELRQAEKEFDGIIFDSFLPGEKMT